MICLHKRLAGSEASAGNTAIATARAITVAGKNKESAGEKKKKVMAHDQGFD